MDKNKKYYYLISLSNINALDLREKNKFDENIINFYNKYKEKGYDDEYISTLIALAIDYPLDYVKTLVYEYKVNGLLDSKDSKLIDYKTSEDLAFSVYFLYSKDSGLIYLFKDEYDKCEKNGKVVQSLVIDDETKATISLEVYNYLLHEYDRLEGENKYNISFFAAKLRNIIKTSDYSNIDYYVNNISIIPYDLSDVKVQEEQKLQIKKVIKTPEQIFDDKRFKFFKGKDVNKYFNKENKFCYTVSFNEVDKNNKRNFINETISELISIAKKNIFVIATSNPESFSYEPALAFNSLDDKVTKYVIAGLRTTKSNGNHFDLTYDEDRKLYVERFSNGIHSKVIIIDDHLVLMGSGNWFSNSPSEYDDSLVAFYSEDAVSKYNPLYNPHTDYYKKVGIQIDKIDNITDALKFCNLINTDALYNSNYTDTDDLRKKIYNKIELLLNSNGNSIDASKVKNVMDDKTSPKWLKDMLQKVLNK